MGLAARWGLAAAILEWARSESVLPAKPFPIGTEQRKGTGKIVAQKDLVIGWLNDAYAMERSISQVLENHAKDAKDLPQVQAKIQQHLETTNRHAEMVKGMLERLGEKPSTPKSMMAAVTGKVQGMSTGMAKDELIKNALADFSTEHMEIASYTSLAEAGRLMGDDYIVQTCETIIQDERAMADWLEQQIPVLTGMMLQQEAR
jgi:ferritin-like metal-binding protein YciE